MLGTESSLATPANVLLVFPRFDPRSFWNLHELCEIRGVRCASPPLGLITVAALLPPHWNVRLVDRNAEELTDADLAWADMVMTGGMLKQQHDTLALIDLCRARGKPVVIGGPDATSQPDVYRGAEIPGRRHQDSRSALRPAHADALRKHRRAVLARLSVQLRVLRHHRAVRPRAARKDQRADAGRARCAP